MYSMVRGVDVEISRAHIITSHGEAEQHPDNPEVILMVQ
jgi:hypothetical protein